MNFGRTDILTGQSKAKKIQGICWLRQSWRSSSKTKQKHGKREKFHDENFFDLEIVRNAFSQSFDANVADFKG